MRNRLKNWMDKHDHALALSVTWLGVLVIAAMVLYVKVYLPLRVMDLEFQRLHGGP